MKYQFAVILVVGLSFASGGFFSFLDKVISDVSVVVADLVGDDEARITTREAAIVHHPEKKDSYSVEIQEIRDDADLVRMFSGLRYVGIDAEKECSRLGGTLVSEKETVGCFNTSILLIPENIRASTVYDLGKGKCESVGAKVILDARNIGCSMQ